jgi:hypothetical protein
MLKIQFEDNRQRLIVAPREAYALALSWIKQRIRNYLIAQQRPLRWFRSLLVAHFAPQSKLHPARRTAGLHLPGLATYLIKSKARQAIGYKVPNWTVSWRL